MASGNGVTYGKCLKNHAIPFYVLDGCGGFYPGGEDGTPESFFCAACGCHRSYHRREDAVPPRPRSRRETTTTFVSISSHPPPLPPPPPTSPPPRPPHIAKRGRTNKARSQADGVVAADEEMKREKKKKTKTVFTEEQRGKMSEFAEKLGWRPVRHDEEEIGKFCEEIGITPPVYKVWINNHRHRGRMESSGELSVLTSAPKN